MKAMQHFQQNFWKVEQDAIEPTDMSSPCKSFLRPTECAYYNAL